MVAVENSVHNFTIIIGRALIDVDEVVKWQRALIADIEECLMGKQDKETA